LGSASAVFGWNHTCFKRSTLLLLLQKEEEGLIIDVPKINQ
jgi:hypothetical protein